MPTIYDNTYQLQTSISHNFVIFIEQLKCKLNGAVTDMHCRLLKQNQFEWAAMALIIICSTCAYEVVSVFNVRYYLYYIFINDTEKKTIRRF